MGLVSITFGLNGYCQAKANNEKGRGIAIASVIIGIFSIIWAIAVTLGYVKI